MSEPGPERDAEAGEQASAAEREQLESLSRVEQGRIPLAAERRLRELGERGGAFTSELSVSDFAMCHQLGLRPLSQVMGSSIYQVGYQATPWPSTLGGGFMFELETLSAAWNEVRGRALGRLAEEAAHVGADAVVGVELRTAEHDWAENSIEYVVVGTAVARDRGRARSTGRPVLTELSVADYANLARAGIEPLGVVAWSSAFFVAASYSTQTLGGGLGFTQNQELGEFTQGIYSAREAVLARMTAQAERLGADGVVGVRINHGIQRISLGGGRYERGGLMASFHAVGTAIGEPVDASFAAPQTTIDLTDRGGIAHE
jgi:uncharacterized protein YbjQ (UPF0145 family)